MKSFQAVLQFRLKKRGGCAATNYPPSTTELAKASGGTCRLLKCVYVYHIVFNSGRKKNPNALRIIKKYILLLLLLFLSGNNQHLQEDDSCRCRIPLDRISYTISSVSGMVNSSGASGFTFSL